MGVTKVVFSSDSPHCLLFASSDCSLFVLGIRGGTKENPGTNSGSIEVSKRSN